MEEMLQFLGKILGIALRAVIPLELRLMPTFWIVLSGESLREDDLRAYEPHLQK